MEKNTKLFYNLNSILEVFAAAFRNNNLKDSKKLQSLEQMPSSTTIFVIEF